VQICVKLKLLHASAFVVTFCTFEWGVDDIVADRMEEVIGATNALIYEVITPPLHQQRHTNTKPTNGITDITRKFQQILSPLLLALWDQWVSRDLVVHLLGKF